MPPGQPELYGMDPVQYQLMQGSAWGRAGAEQEVQKAKERKERYSDLQGSGDAARAFAGQGQQFYGDRTTDMLGVRDALQRQMSGQDSISAEQLRQGLMQNRAAQQSMAAGARPGNAAMAARTAAIQGGRLGAGLAGQQALAGIAERQAATDSLGRMLGQMRGQDVQVGLGAEQNAIDAFGRILADKTQRAGQPSNFDKLLGAASGAGQAYLTGK